MIIRHLSCIRHIDQRIEVLGSEVCIRHIRKCRCIVVRCLGIVQCILQAVGSRALSVNVIVDGAVIVDEHDSPDHTLDVVSLHLDGIEMCKIPYLLQVNLKYISVNHLVLFHVVRRSVSRPVEECPYLQAVVSVDAQLAVFREVGIEIGRHTRGAIDDAIATKDNIRVVVRCSRSIFRGTSPGSTPLLIHISSKRYLMSLVSPEDIHLHEKLVDGHGLVRVPSPVITIPYQRGDIAAFMLVVGEVKEIFA